MSLAVAGLAVIGRDSYGVFPLRCVFHACIKQEYNNIIFDMYDACVTWQQHISSTQPDMSWLQNLAGQLEFHIASLEQHVLAC